MFAHVDHERAPEPLRYPDIIANTASFAVVGGHGMSSRALRTRLLHPEASAPHGFKSLSTPVFRGSTTLFDSAEHIQDTWNHDDAPYTYGSYGTPTTLELAARVAEICLLYTSPSPRDGLLSRMPSSA